MKAGHFTLTADLEQIRACNFYIVAVPTPVNDDRSPDVKPVEGASEIVGKVLSKGDYVVFESTVYPGLTEELCIPIIEKLSGLKYMEEWKLGYSPERINPGDKVHTFKTIKKIVSGCDAESLDKIAKVYEMVVEPGVCRAASIKVAEAAKVIENSQRDINIAFMNELAKMFDKMGIDTNDVLDAAGTKWNFLHFRPGLVGGHCIGVDPYYLTYRAQNLGYTSTIIQNGRLLNDGMGAWIATQVVKNMVQCGLIVKGARVCVMGLTFKENCPDLRNSKVNDIIKELKEYEIEVVSCDPLGPKEEAKRFYGVDLVDFDTIKDCDAVVMAVAHNDYAKLSMSDLKKLFKPEIEHKLVYDVKGVISRENIPSDMVLKRL
jgi:UDP-N-acetyl-D-galactosamine dehydrogenase